MAVAWLERGLAVSAHTPGKWAIDRRRRARGYAVAIFSGDRAICDVPDQNGDPGNDPESDANARLIAAAPDLLEALERAERALANTREHNPHDLGPSDTLIAVRAAIARAKGGVK